MQKERQFHFMDIGISGLIWSMWILQKCENRLEECMQEQDSNRVTREIPPSEMPFFFGSKRHYSGFQEWI